MVATLLGAAAIGATVGAMLMVRSHRRATADLQARAAAVESRARLLEAQLASHQLVLQSMTTGIVALDEQQRIVSMNAAAERLFGIPGGSARGRLLPEVVRAPEVHRFVNDAIAAGGSARREITLDSASAGILQLAAEPMLDPRGTPAGLLIAADDVTAERRLEAMRSDFAANVSHELRTPITNIKGYVETLLDIGWEDPGRAQQFLGVIRDNARRLAQLVEDILSLSSLEQRQVHRRLQFEPVELRELVTGVLDEMQGTAEAREIQLMNEVPEGLTVTGSKSLLGQAVVNLVQNAVQYSAPRTTVRVRAEASGGQCTMSVHDQGPGIAAKHLPRLFERFYRVDHGRSREAGGTGLGLAIVKHIAMVHGGKVSVESELGRGSTFTIQLPKDQRQVELAA
ncbi:MAG: PAS domain-containing protein [Phycisphaeraceae bacterium]|nr:PAS domain-containing protein [Phycisphaeraceae bacterium]